MRDNELDRRAGDFGWIVSADALRPDVACLRDITAALRHEARVENGERASWFSLDQLTLRPSPSQ
jgi:hypothetical protein